MYTDKTDFSLSNIFFLWPRRLRAELGEGGTTVTKNLDFLLSPAQIKTEAVSHTGGFMRENCRKSLAAAQLWSWLVAAVFLAQIESFFQLNLHSRIEQDIL